MKTGLPQQGRVRQPRIVDTPENNAFSPAYWSRSSESWFPGSSLVLIAASIQGP